MAPRVTAARMAAFRVLLAMERSSNTHCDESAACARDGVTVAGQTATSPQRWSWAYCAGSLRLTPILARYLKRKSALDDAVAIALRLGAWQLLGMDRIPAHAALAESVELTKVAGHSFASGLGECGFAPRGGKCFGDRTRSASSAHPAWMMERWTKQFGRDAASSIAAYDQRPLR